MVVKIADRVFETSTTTGTGTLTLAGAQQGFQPFSVMLTASKVSYYIDDADNTGLAQNWEAGIGTIVNTGGTWTLSRDTILASSNSNVVVNFGIGTKNVRGGVPAAIFPIVDENLNNVRHKAINTTGSTANVHTIALQYTPIAYSDGLIVSYKVPITNSTAGVTLNVNGKGAIALKTDNADPGIGALPANATVFAMYNSTTNTFDILNILPAIATMTILSNITGAAARAIGNTMTAIFDAVFGSTQGMILYRNASAWVTLAVGTAGQALLSGGAAANVSWGTVTNPVKAWVNFNGTGTVAIRASLNVTSITDNGTGDYTVNFTTAFADALYAFAGSAEASSGFRVMVSNDLTTARTVSLIRILAVISTNGVSDPAHVNAIFTR